MNRFFKIYLRNRPYALLGIVLFSFFFSGCTTKEKNLPVPVLSANEALGLLKNDFAVLVDAFGKTPVPSESKTWIVFFMETTNKDKKNQAEAKAQEWIAKGQKVYLLGGTPEEWNSLQLPLKEGHF